MAKKKTTEYYKKKRDSIRQRKRILTSSAGSRTAEEVKNEKKRLKEEYRGFKRSEKQQVKREINETLMDSDRELYVESVLESQKQEFIDEMDLFGFDPDEDEDDL